MAFRNIDNINIEGAKIIYRNFAGKEVRVEGRTVNREGDRNFCVVIDDLAVAQKLAEDGWKVVIKAKAGEEETPMCYLPVAVKYTNFPPNVYMKVGNKKKTLLDEESISALDYAEIKTADLVIRPYCWEVNGKTGVKAYLKTAFVAIEEDVFADKWADEDEAPWE